MQGRGKVTKQTFLSVPVFWVLSKPVYQWWANIKLFLYLGMGVTSD